MVGLLLRKNTFQFSFRKNNDLYFILFNKGKGAKPQRPEKLIWKKELCHILRSKGHDSKMKIR